MKCPKCGSEMQHRKTIGVYSCRNEECLYTIPEDTITYQQRLDKVLENLKQYASGRSKTIMELGYQRVIEIQYYREKFWLADVGYNGGWKHRMVISLDTVEHLLKDLEQ